MASIPIYIYWFIESHAQSAQLRKGNPSLVVVKGKHCVTITVATRRLTVYNKGLNVGLNPQGKNKICLCV